MGNYLKLFDTHSEYEAFKQTEDFILPNVSHCITENHVHYNPYIPKATIRLTFNVSEPGSERISVAGDLSPFGGSSDADGFSNVESIRIDGVKINMENDITRENIVNYFGVVIDGYFYNFTTIGEHTIEYVLKDMTVKEGICCAIGNFEYSGIQFPSNITDASVVINADDIDACSFAYSTAIENVTINGNVTSIGNKAFIKCENLTSVILPNSVTSIGEYTFHQCYSLTTINIPNSVTSIGQKAFDNCYSLTTINIPNGIITINPFTFACCRSLTGVTIPNSVTSIGNYAFGECDGLTTITIPSGVTSIGENAFYLDYNIISVTVEATTPPIIYNNTFSSTVNVIFYVPAESVEAYKAASGWSTYASQIQAIPSA